MKYSMHVLIFSISLFFLFTSCEKEQMLDKEILMENPNNDYESNKASSGKQVIVLAAPSIHNTYYSEQFSDIVDFQVDGFLADDLLVEQSDIVIL